MEKVIACIVMIFAMIIIYVLLCNLYIFLFRITGLSKSVAKFQVFTLFMCCGYSTSEAELIMYDKTRKKIAMYCSATGYIFSVILASLILGVISGLDFKSPNRGNYLLRISIVFIICVACFVGFMFLIKIPKLRKLFANFITKLFYRHKITPTGNIITFSDQICDKYIATINLKELPYALKGLTLGEINFKKIFDIDILVIEPKGQAYISQIPEDYILQEGDKIQVFGNAKIIKKLFSIDKTEEQKKHEKEIE